MTPTLRPALHDFDVITDVPAPQRRLPEPAEQAPPPGTVAEHAAPVPVQEAERVRAAE
jgi:hypothetical protein